MYNYFTSGNLEKKGDPSFTEGIGQARITKNLENCEVDMSSVSYTHLTLPTKA